MNYISFSLDTGLPVSVFTPSNDSLYKDGEIRDGILVKTVDEAISHEEIMDTYHWTGSEVGIHPPKEDSLAIWDKTTFSFGRPSYWLDVKKRQAVGQVNETAYVRITNVYPTYKQLNLGRDPTSQEALDMYAFIDNVRNKSNLDNEQIMAATSYEQLQEVSASF